MSDPATHTSNFTLRIIPTDATFQPWLLHLLGLRVRGLNPNRPRMKDRAHRRRAGYTRTGGLAMSVWARGGGAGDAYPT